jgi:hypothetical protein
MRQIEDTKTAELPGMPAAKRRGRPPLGDRAMTAAERQRASRKARFQAGLINMSLTTPVQFNAMVDIATREKLKRVAAEQGLTMGQLLDRLVEQL